MRLKDIEVGAHVRVRRGYSIRPAVVTEVRTDGTVGVRFTDVDGDTAKAVGPNRSYLFGADVRPNAIV